MRLKASYPQRILMLLFIFAVGLWAAWPNSRLIVLVLVACIAAGVYLLLPARRQ